MSHDLSVNSGEFVAIKSNIIGCGKKHLVGIAVSYADCQSAHIVQFEFIVHTHVHIPLNETQLSSLQVLRDAVVAHLELRLTVAGLRAQEQLIRICAW
jgi:hypothetical protein